MRREDLAITGAPARDGAFRLELEHQSTADYLRLEQLHADEVGTFARVFRGRIGSDESALPVAVKLQRDVSLTREQNISVKAKFDIERSVHRRIQSRKAPETITAGHVVRQIDFRHVDSPGADVLPPSIVCALAPFSLGPRCPSPECGGLLEPDEWAQGDDERRLVCSRCTSRYSASESTRQRILESTVRRDVACHSCPVATRPDSGQCLRTALFLNFFPSRVLVLELLDLDLHDYVEWGSLTRAPEGRGWAWKRYQEHRRIQERRMALGLEGPCHLTATIDLFQQVLDGLETLHDEQIAHLDLKPHNICLGFDGDRVRVKLIDLGLAEDPQSLVYLRQVQGTKQIDHEFAAPEVVHPAASFPEVRFKVDDGALLIAISPRPLEDNSFFPVLEAGDRISLKVPNRGEVEGTVAQVQYHRESLRARVVVSDGGEDVRSSLGGTASLSVRRVCGQPADLFSVGMILIALLTRQMELQGFRDGDLPAIRALLEGELKSLHESSGQSLYEIVKSRNLPFQLFRRLDSSLDRFGEARPLAEELFGVALRCLLRGPKHVFYLEGRGTPARSHLQSLCSDVERVRRAVAILETREAAKRLTVSDLSRLRELRNSVSRATDAAAMKAVRRPSLDELRRKLALFLDDTPDELKRVARDLLRGYGGRRKWLLDDIDALSRALLQRPDEPAEPDFPLLGKLVPFAYPIASNGAQLKEFQDAWAPAEELAQAFEPVKLWRDDHAELARMIDGFDTALAAWKEFADRLEFILIRPSLDGFEAHDPYKVKLEIERRSREQIDEKRAGRALEVFARLFEASDQRLQDHKSKFESLLSDWDALDGPWKVHTFATVEAAKRQLRQALQEQKKWKSQANQVLDRLRRFYDWALGGLLGKWDVALQPSGGLIRFFVGESQIVKISFTRGEIEPGLQLDHGSAVKTIENLQLGPGTRVEAALAIAQLINLRAAARLPEGGNG